MFKPTFGVQIFGAQMFAKIFAHIWGKISADFSSVFWCFKSRHFGVAQRCAQNQQKNPRRPNSLAWVGALFRLRLLEQTARHTITAKLKYSRRACERPSWPLWAQKACLHLLQDFSKICEKSALRTPSLYMFA